MEMEDRLGRYADMFQALVPGLVRIYQDDSMQIILYGSAARGTETEESDIDIAVILTSYTREMYDQMLDMVVDLELEYNKVLSVHLIPASKFSQWENVMPYYQNVKREGIVLWPAA